MAPLSPPPTFTKVGHFNSFQPARRLYQNDPPQKCTEEKNKTHFLQIRWFSARYTPLIYNNSTHTHSHTRGKRVCGGGVFLAISSHKWRASFLRGRGFIHKFFGIGIRALSCWALFTSEEPLSLRSQDFIFFCWNPDLWVCEVLPGCVWCCAEELEWLLYRELCRAWCALRRARTIRAPASPWKVRFRSYPYPMSKYT